MLIERGADAKRECQSPDRLKNTLSPVLLAAGHKHYTMVRLLWDAGAPAQDKQSTMLVAAAECGDVKEIKRLLAEGTEPNTPDPLTGEWPLNAAAKAGNLRRRRGLAPGGSPRRARAASNRAHLCRWVFGIERRIRRKDATAEVVEDHVQVAKLLLAAGANPSARVLRLHSVVIGGGSEVPTVDRNLESGRAAAFQVETEEMDRGRGISATGRAREIRTLPAGERSTPPTRQGRLLFSAERPRQSGAPTRQGRQPRDRRALAGFRDRGSFPGERRHLFVQIWKRSAVE